jgi:hypothetical protein
MRVLRGLQRPAGNGRKFGLRPPRKRRRSARTDVAEAGGTGDREEARGKGASRCRTHFPRSPAMPEPSGEGVAKGISSEFASMKIRQETHRSLLRWGTERGPVEACFDGKPFRAYAETAMFRGKPGSGTFRSFGGGRNPVGNRSAAARPRIGTRGNRPGPQGLGRNPTGPEEPAFPDRCPGRPFALAGERFDLGQWGLAALPAPICIYRLRLRLAGRALERPRSWPRWPVPANCARAPAEGEPKPCARSD